MPAICYPFALAVILISLSVSAQAEVSENEMKSIIEDLQKVESKYRDYQAEVEITTFGQEKEISHSKVASRGNWFRWDSPKGTLIVTPTRSASVRKDSKTSTFVVNRLYTTEPKIRSEIERLKLGVKLPYAATSYFELALTELFSSSEIELISLTNEQLGSEKVKVLEAVSHLQADLPLRMRWYFLDSKPKLLIKHEVTNDQIPNLKRVTDLSYGSTVGGVPFPKKIRSAVLRDNEVASIDFEGEIINLVAQSPSADFFSLKQFGLDDTIGRSSSNTRYVVFGTLGILITTFGLFRSLKYHKR